VTQPSGTRPLSCLFAGPRASTILVLFLTLAAFGLRVWRLDQVPPGWRDDELIEALVISQKILDGDLALFYPDASGHEVLYHALAAVMLALFGPGVAGIRWLSAVLGSLTVPLTYLVGRTLFNRRVGLVAAAALTVSFWSLMYSRFGIRQISMPVFMLLAFYTFLRGLKLSGWPGGSEAAIWQSRASGRAHWLNFGLAGLFLGIGFYTYFAARGVPIIMLAFCLYLFIFFRLQLRSHLRGIVLTAGLALLLALPLIITLQQQPAVQARVSEVGKPLREALEGNFRPMLENTIRTLNMTHSDGDDEWLYNIPYRPLFGPIGALFFWGGVIVAAWYGLQPLWRWLFGRRLELDAPCRTRPQWEEAAGAFLIIWWLAGISPGFLSVPAASLGHTITAQPAIYLLFALPLWSIGRWLRGRSCLRPDRSLWLTTSLGLLLVLSTAWRDLPDYFQEWPRSGLTRFLYRADIKNLADYLNDRPELTDFAVTSLLAGPWDREALRIDLERPGTTRPRWYNGERVVMLAIDGRPPLSFSGYPVGPVLHEDWYRTIAGESAGGYRLTAIDAPPLGDNQPVCFANGLCLAAAEYNGNQQSLELVWRVNRPLDLPPLPLISNPPPPDVYAGPRLLVFAQLLDLAGHFLVGDDGLWVDIATLYPGDVFLQQHRLPAPDESSPAAVLFGLYDPMTGQRILTLDGQDHVRRPLQGTP
jgi:4-amino-4-deoxy-L-arabinose transferase-like glycosyltransferase